MNILRRSPFAQSSNGVGSDLDLDRLSGYGDDPPNSTSYVASMDLSPDPITGGWVLNSLSSGESGFPLDWTQVSYDPIASSPMSTNLSDTGFFGSVEGIGEQFQQRMADINRSRTGSVNDPLENLQQQQQPSQQIYNARPIFTAQPAAPSVSGTSQNVGWNFAGVPPLTFQSENTSWAEPASASSYTTHSSHEPWSFESQPRYPGIAGADAPLFGPHTELVISQDVMSWSSSPALNPVQTPSSSHSPIFSAPTLQHFSQSPSTSAPRPTLHLEVERTPKARQPSSFSRRPPSVVIHQAPSTQNSIQSDQNSEVSRRSPAGDFVFVQSPTQAQTMVDQKPLPSQLNELQQSVTSPQSPPPQARPHQTTVFVQQHFPAKDSSNTRISTELVRRTSAGGTKRGGRAVGSHLSTEGAARAKRLREEGSCWLCCLQRDSCTPGEICERCIKRNQRATLEHGLGCDRTKLTELKPYFVPDVITRLHEPQALKAFCAQHIKRWSGVSIKLKFNVIWTLPAIECEVYEFEPKTRELLRQFQYITDPETRRRTRVEKASPPLAMVQIEHADRQKYDKYLTMVVENHLEQFAERVYDIESEDFPTRLYRLMVRFKPDNKEEASLLRDIHRLLVCTYIMCRTATIPNSQKDLLYKLHSYPASRDAYAHAPSPRMANRQLKYLFCQLQQTILDAILKKLQQVLRSSKGPQKWTSAFIAILGLAMSFELTQRLVHVVADADAAMGKYSIRDAEYVAETACRAIDEKFAFISNLFRWKYHRGFNPLREVERDSVKQVLGEKGVEFVRGVTSLIAEKHENFLFERQYVGISTGNQDRYTSRLVARFFSSFLSPQ